MALNAGQIILDVIANTSKLKPQIQAGAKEAFKGYQDAAARAGKVAGGDLSVQTGKAALAAAAKPFTNFAVGASKVAGKALIGGFAVAGTAAAAGIGVALAKGFGRLTAIDDARAKLAGLGHSTQTVETIMNNALNAVRGTAYGLDEAATVSASLVAAGIKPGKELEGVLKTVADSATIAGVDLNSMGVIFGKVAATGRLQGDEMNQMMEAGIPILQLLGKHYGKNADEVRKMVSEGKVSFQDFEAAMRQGMGGAALEAGQTFTGAMRNMWASVSRIGANMLSGIFGQLAPLITEITGGFGNIEEAAKGFGDMVGPIFKTVIDLVRDFISDMSGAGGSFDWMGTVKGILEGLAGAFEGFMNVLRVVVPVMGTMLAVGLKLVDWILKLLRPIFESETAMKALTIAFLAFAGIGVIISVINAVRGAILGVQLAMKAAELAENASRATTLAYNAAMAIKTTVTNIATAAQWLWNAAMAAGLLPIIAIVAGIALLVAGFIIAYKKSETFRKIVNGAINAVKAAFLAVVDWITGSFVPFFTDTIPGAFQAVLSWVQDKWAAVTGFISRPIDAARGLITNAINGIRDFIGGAVGAIGTSIGAIGTAWNAVAGAVRTAWNAIRPIFVAIGNAFGAIGQGFKRVYDGWISPVFQLIGAIVKWVWNGVMSAIFAAIRAGFQAVGNLFRAVWNNFLKPVIDAYARAFQGLWNNVLKPVGNAIKAAFQAVGNLVRAVWRNWIKPVIDAYRAAFSALWNNVLKPVGNSIKAGFQAVGTLVRNIWRNWIRPVIDAYRNAFQALWNNVLKPVGLSIRDAFTAVGTTIRNVYNNTIKAVFGWFENRARDLRDLLARVWNKIKDLWAGMGNGIKNFYNNNIKPIFGWFGDAAAGMRDRFNRIINKIGDYWNKLKGWALKPIQFVVDTVINKGLIRGFNKLARFFGTKEMEWLPVPKMASGGIPYPNRYTPGRDIGLAAVSGGEPIMRPEFGRAVGPGWVDEANRIARTRGVPGVRQFMGSFAGGGTVSPVPGRGNRHTSGYEWATWAGDFPEPYGTPVKAWKAGVVAMVKSLTSSYGKHVRMNHDDGTSSLYAHMSRILVNLGQQLKAGNRVGLVGTTGNSTGPHLHFETMGGPFSGDGGDAGVWDMITNFGKVLTDPLRELVSKHGDNMFVKLITETPKKVLTWAVDKVTGLAKALFDKATGWIKGATAWVGAKIGAYSSEQLNNAATIINVAKSLGFGDRGAIIGLMTAMQESTLRNLSGGDRDSVGLFQQRAPWGSFADRTNPSRAAQMFFQGGQGGQPGLRSKAWRTMGLGEAAQAVQVSAYPDAYAKWEDEARKLLARFNKSGSFDDGGWLPRGLSLSFNGTRASEPAAVFTNDQWATLRAVADGSGGRPSIGTVNIELNLDDLAQMKTLEDFLNIIDKARVRGRTVARSGTVSD